MKTIRATLMGNSCKIQNKLKFVSPAHIGYNPVITLEVLKPQDGNQYKLTNVTQMQVVDLQLALQIYINQNRAVSQSKYIFTLDRSAQIALEHNSKKEEGRGKCTIQESFYNSISIIQSNQETLDINTIMIELASFLNEKDIGGSTKKINTRFNEIKKNLESYKNKTLNIDNIKDCDFSNTKKILEKGKNSLEQVMKSLRQYEKMSKEDFENRFNKDSISLAMQIFNTTHMPLLAHILVHKLSSNLAKQFLFRIFLGGITGPIGIIISIAWLLVDIYEFFSSKRQEDEMLSAAYRLYGAIISIYENIDYSLASLLNFGHIGFGNLITTQNNDTLIYHLYPSYNEFNSTFVYNIIGKSMFKDTPFKVSLSLQKETIEKGKYLQNIFETSNRDLQYNIANTQFSIFSVNDMLFAKDSTAIFGESSAFQHFKNIFLRFDSFLFVKTSSFSSVLANDMLLQSFRESNQGNPARINKTALFLTNCLHNGLPDYKVQQHIKHTLQNNENTKKDVLFLSAICRVEKSVLVREFLKQMGELFNQLENYAYMNLTQQIRRSQKICLLISKYKLGEVSYHSFDNHIISYSLDDNLINDLDVNEFCNFMSELCAIFITREQADMTDKYMDNILRLQYGNNEQKYQEAKSNIKDIFIQMNTIIADISKILSYFNSFSFANLQHYRKEIDNIYKQQKKGIENFFNTKSLANESTDDKTYNIFYNMDSIKNICIGILNRYFNTNIKSEPFASLEYLSQEYQKIQFDSLETSIKDRDKIEYTNILKNVIEPILPLDDSTLNCLSDEEILYFYTIIIGNIKNYAEQSKDKEQYQVLQNLIGMYYTNLAIFESLTTRDETMQDKIYKIYNDKNIQGLLETILNGIADIGKDSAKEIVKELLKDKYFIVASSINNNVKDIIKDLTTNIANIYDAKNPYINQLNSLTEFSKNQKIYNFTSIIAKVTVGYVANAILDKLFSTQIENIEAMKQEVIALLVAMNRHRDTPYATCKKGSKYLTLPIEITQTLINADLQAMIIGGSPLNSGFCIHSPSVALFNEDNEKALNTLLQTLRNFMNYNVNIDKIGEKGGKIVKEAYAKIWFYLDMGENKQSESYLRNELQVNPKYYTLRNLTSDAYIQTKLKITQDSNDKLFLENNSEKKFIAMEGNAKGGIHFNRDFLIQLKRVAEWNYRVYEEKEVLTQTQNEAIPYSGLFTKESSPDEWLGGNLIYDKEFIPTTIDIKD